MRSSKSLGSPASRRRSIICSSSDLRKISASNLYDYEVERRKQGWGDPVFVYDEEKRLFR